MPELSWKQVYELAYLLPMDNEKAELATRACGDIPPAYCHVAGVEISGDAATVWLVTNGPHEFEEYEVEFDRVDGSWRDGAGHGSFQTGTPDSVYRAASRIKSRLHQAAQRGASGSA